jgi:hypothetical protein
MQGIFGIFTLLGYLQASIAEIKEQRKPSPKKLVLKIYLAIILIRRYFIQSLPDIALFTLLRYRQVLPTKGLSPLPCLILMKTAISKTAHHYYRITT